MDRSLKKSFVLYNGKTEIEFKIFMTIPFLIVTNQKKFV